MHTPAKLSKAMLKQQLIRMLELELETLQRAHRASIEGATHEEARPENDKDTRALEQSYLARGQAHRVEELAASLAELHNMPVRDFADSSPAALGAVVTVQEADTTRSYLLAPAGGGATLADGRVQVVTIQSPLGRALLGKRCGELCSFSAAGRVRELELVGID